MGISSRDIKIKTVDPGVLPERQINAYIDGDFGPGGGSNVTFMTVREFNRVWDAA